MTNEEKAAELAYYYASENDYKESAAYSAAIGMAQWKDEQFAKEKQALIDKACVWLNVFLNTHYIMRYKDNCEPDKSWIIEVFKRIIK